MRMVEILPRLTIYDHKPVDMKLPQKTISDVYAKYLDGNIVGDRTKGRFNLISVY